MLQHKACISPTESPAPHSDVAPRKMCCLGEKKARKRNQSSPPFPQSLSSHVIAARSVLPGRSSPGAMGHAHCLTRLASRKTFSSASLTQPPKLLQDEIKPGQKPKKPRAGTKPSAQETRNKILHTEQH